MKLDATKILLTEGDFKGYLPKSKHLIHIRNDNNGTRKENGSKIFY